MLGLGLGLNRTNKVPVNKGVWLPPTHLYTSEPGGYAVSNDGTYNWVTEIYDQIGSNDAVQVTQDYRTKMDGGAFYQDKDIAARINYVLNSQIPLSVASGFALVIVGKLIYSGNGFFYFTYGTTTNGNAYTFGSNTIAMSIYGSGGGISETLSEAVSSIGVITQNKSFVYNNKNLYSSDFTTPVNANINHILGRPLAVGGNYLFCRGRVNEIGVYKDQFLTDTDIGGLIAFYKHKYKIS